MLSIVHYYADNVESGIAKPMVTADVLVGHTNQILAFAVIHRILRSAETCIASCLHLNNHQITSLDGDQVYLMFLRLVVVFYNSVAMFRQPLIGNPLALHAKFLGFLATFQTAMVQNTPKDLNVRHIFQTI